MEEIINEMKSTYSTMENYKNLIPDDLSSWGHAGLSKNDFFESFLALIEMAEKIGNISANSRFTSLVKTNIRNTLTNINNQLKSFNSNPTAYFNNIRAPLKTG